MKHFLLNLKRFDVPRSYGGVNSLSDIDRWAETIVTGTQEELKSYSGKAEFTMYFPEAHLISANRALCGNSPVIIGCQSVYRADVRKGGNFGAFTGSHPAAAMKALGVRSAIIGHCEERANFAGVMAEAGVQNTQAVNRLLNQEILSAQAQGLSVTYCIGEKAEERDRWQEVLREQLAIGLENADRSRILIAYEPIWAIGPGKTPPDPKSIQTAAQFIKRETNGLPVLYGGGLKQDNAAGLAAIAEIDGGLIALTRFSGEIGFYPDEYLDIIRIYMDAAV